MAEGTPDLPIEDPSRGPVITGVATSITAFVGHAASGPLNSATHILSFADFEREFGGLAADSEMSYAVYQFFLNGGSDAWIVRVPESPEPANPSSAFIGDRTAGEGIYALETVDLFNLLCLPGVSDGGVLSAAAAYCQERRALLIVDAPGDALTPDQVAAAVTASGFPVSDNAALYYPWIAIADPLDGGQARPCAPGGAVAGIFARIDSSSGIWKAPAGLHATLSGAQGVQYALTEAENARLTALGVNCIRSFPSQGIVLWGARLLRPGDSPREYKYVSVRRLALFIEQSVERGLQWATFEPNDSTLWVQICASVGGFLHDLFRQGAFQGSRPQDACFVRCGQDVITQAEIDQGLVNVVIGCAVVKPAEFVIIRVQVHASAA